MNRITQIRIWKHTAAAPCMWVRNKTPDGEWECTIETFDALVRCGAHAIGSRGDIARIDVFVGGKWVNLLDVQIGNSVVHLL